jgi:single-strand DNA-binding protein
MLNKVMLIGHVGQDPEVQTTKGGSLMATFSLATTKKWRDKEGERKESTTWHRIVVFNENVAKVVQQYVKKGSRLYVEGEIATRKYTDKAGVDRYSTEILLSTFHSQLALLDKSEGGGNRAPAPESEADYGTQKKTTKEEIDDDIPY